MWLSGLGVVLQTEPKGCRSDSWSGHIPGLWARSLVGGVGEANRLMFLSHISVSLLYFALPSPLSGPENKIALHIQGRR